jgi:hypothetical protein
MNKLEQHWTKFLLIIILAEALFCLYLVFNVVIINETILAYNDKQSKIKSELEFYREGYRAYQLQEYDLIKAGATKEQAVELIKASSLLECEYVGK